MVELLKKHKVIVILVILVFANICWYMINESKETEVSTKLSSPNNPIAAWQEHSQSLAEADPVDLTDSSLETVQAQKTVQAQTVPTQTVPAQSPNAELNQTMPFIEKIKVPVYICGAINLPGVYYVDNTTILNDVVKMSGGFTSSADINYLNLASTIVPNQKIYIPKIGEEIDKTVNSYENIEVGSLPGTSVSTPQVGQEVHAPLININTATETQLQSLSGIGEVKAKAIIDYRTTIGRFKTIDELLNVTGIADKTLEKMKPFITV